MHLGFPSISAGKESASSLRDLGLIPRLGRSPGEGNGNPLQSSCLENAMDRGVWRATAHWVSRVGHDLVTQPTKMQGILLFKKLRFASGQHLTKCYALLSTGLRMIVHA